MAALRVKPEKPRRGRPPGTAREWSRVLVLLDPGDKSELEELAREAGETVVAIIRGAIKRELARRRRAG